MEGNVVISPTALLLITTIVSGLCGAIGLLFRSLIASKDTQIADLRSDNKELKALAYRQTNVTNRSISLAEVLAAAQQAGISTEGG